MKKRFISLFCSVILLLGNLTPASAGILNGNKVTAVYFYSPTCGSCQELKAFLEDLKSRHRNLSLVEYSISDLRYKSLLDKYNEAYKVSGKDGGTVPIIFIRDKYFADENKIKKYLESVILDTRGPNTIEVKVQDNSHNSDMERFFNYRTLGILAAGAVNGINPCSISMLLMLMSLLLFKKSTVLKVGISYSMGRFIGYVLLGTVFFSFLDRFHINGFNTILKILMLLIITVLVLLNINDYIAAVNEKYNRIRLQLPLSFRKFNHKLIRRVSSITNTKLLVLISIGLGMFISLGEFLCTGQIYLTTIVTVFQTNAAMGSRALYFLLVYNVGFILPALVLTYIIYKGKEIFDLSEAIRERLHVIKLINVLMFFVFGIIMFTLF